MEQVNLYPQLGSTTLPKCAGCGQSIHDRYVMSVNEQLWHERCLTCTVCQHLLTQSCYVKEGSFYCKQHYLKLYSIKCSGCYNPISPTELVMRLPGGPIYHTTCFACIRCGRQLVKGDQFAVRSGRLVCRDDLEKDAVVAQFEDGNSPDASGGRGRGPPPEGPGSSLESSAMAMLDPAAPGLQMDSSYSPKAGPGNCDSNGRMDTIKSEGPPYSPEPPQISQAPKPETGSPVKLDSRRGPKRPRTILTTDQRKAFKVSFEISQKPCRKVRESLAKETGLSVRIVQVWFQNQRAKLKKIQRKQQKAKLVNGSEGGDPGSGGFLTGNGSESGGIGSHDSSDKSKDDSADEEDDDDGSTTTAFGMQTMQYMIQSPEESFDSTNREEESGSSYIISKSNQDDSETSLEDDRSSLQPNSTSSNQLNSIMSTLELNCLNSTISGQNGQIFLPPSPPQQHHHLIPPFSSLIQARPYQMQTGSGIQNRDNRTPIDKLYSMQNSYFSNSHEQECL